MSSRRTAELRGAASRIPRAAFMLMALHALSCSYTRGDRWLRRTSADAGAPAAACRVGDEQCGTGVERCKDGPDGPAFATVDDCGARGLVCSPGTLTCVTCVPDQTRCNGAAAERCEQDGSGFVPQRTCDATKGEACREGGCVNLCVKAAEERSNVGCEYWAADLDNADIDASENAAAQQYAIVVSNPEPDVAAAVTVEQDDSAPGEPNAAYPVAQVTVPPMSLRVIRLGPREVDGSPRGAFNTGTGTAVTRSAFRVKSTVPIILVQFNPLDNVNVFSNDASLLKPVEALGGGGGVLTTSYVVLGWPETIATTDDPDTNFDPTNPLDLRAFLTIVGTRPDTHVRVHTRAAIVPGGPIAATPAGETVEVSLEPFDVVNLETGSFKADFTGSIVEADQPVVVFSGSEASDAPIWNKLSQRQCCADHLEEQLDPIRTAGKQFVATISPNRTDAVIAAGATLGHFDAPEFFRIVAATDAGATVRTTLDAPNDEITLSGLGDFATVTAKQDFTMKSDQPISVSSVSPSQGASGVPFGLPGGDPSFIIVPPIEQFRDTYVFLTPSEYNFDFVRIVAPAKAQVLLDGARVDRTSGCKASDVPAVEANDDAFRVYKCQLSFPVIDTSIGATTVVSPGTQNDGVHQIVASDRIGVIVNGFDTNVGYGYAAGTQLTEIVTR